MIIFLVSKSLLNACLSISSFLVVPKSFSPLALFVVKRCLFIFILFTSLKTIQHSCADSCQSERQCPFLEGRECWVSCSINLISNQRLLSLSRHEPTECFEALFCCYSHTQLFGSLSQSPIACLEITSLQETSFLLSLSPLYQSASHHLTLSGNHQFSCR